MAEIAAKSVILTSSKPLSGRANAWSLCDAGAASNNPRSGILRICFAVLSGISKILFFVVQVFASLRLFEIVAVILSPLFVSYRDRASILLAVLLLIFNDTISVIGVVVARVFSFFVSVPSIVINALKVNALFAFWSQTESGFRVLMIGRERKVAFAVCT